MVLAGRVCERVRRHVFLRDEGIRHRLTASTGVATLPDAARDADGLVRSADLAMYLVKADGMDGIRLARPDAREGVPA